MYGTVRFRGRLDHLLGLHLRKGLGSLPPDLVPVLRLAVHQLLHMDGTPAYAAVSQAVEQTRALGHGRLARVVNGVLRSLDREGGGMERFPALDTDPVGHLTHWGSHPRWLVERWVGVHGVQGTARLVEASNRVPSTYLLPLGLVPEEAVARLHAAGIEAEEAPPGGDRASGPAPSYPAGGGVASVGPMGSRTVRLGRGTSPEAALAAVTGIIQDPAAGSVVRWCGAVDGLTTLDLCAAPGGKALALAAAGARVMAADLSFRRLTLVREGARRTEFSLPLVQASAEAPPFRPADLVLLDAPCSGTGTLARHPDGRWRLAESDISALSRVQASLLDGAAPAVAPGGLLVYSTCTLEPEENENQVDSFLRRHRDFILEGGGEGDSEGGGAGASKGFGDPFLRVLPSLWDDHDGAFAARLRRR